MALRSIRTQGDEVLTKVCKPVKEITPKIAELIDDMIETMQDADGVGLAAPQVGVLRRLCVIDVGEENGTPEPLVLINPEVIESSGEQCGDEGCLSLPGFVAPVTRPMNVTVEAQDINLNKIKVFGEGLLARALCHEIDHLNGHMYTDFAEGPLRDINVQPEEEEE